MTQAPTSQSTQLFAVHQKRPWRWEEGKAVNVSRNFSKWRKAFALQKGPECTLYVDLGETEGSGIFSFQLAQPVNLLRIQYNHVFSLITPFQQLQCLPCQWSIGKWLTPGSNTPRPPAAGEETRQVQRPPYYLPPALVSFRTSATCLCWSGVF